MLQVAELLRECRSVGVYGDECPDPFDVRRLALDWVRLNQQREALRNGDALHDAHAYRKRVVLGLGIAFVDVCDICGRVKP